MAARRRLDRKSDNRRPVVTDDFIYDEPGQQVDDDNTESMKSDTPEEAVRKLRKKPQGTPSSGEKTDSSLSSEESGVDVSSVVYSSGIMLDENLQPVHIDKRKRHKRHPVIRGIVLVLITLILMMTAAAYIFHHIFPDDTPLLGKPESIIGSVATPVQNFFSGLTESVFGYFRSMKLRANIEAEYNALRAENEQLTYKAMLADELQHTLSQYEDLSAEIKANQDMKSILCSVIGKSDSNYFSTLTINKGSEDGIQDFMAVTISGALVGYTVSTQPHKATVRTIIDSDASIAALIQSSRDQGTVRGTLGIDGTPLCRMYYLPDDNLPRPGDLVVTSGVGMSFPKGIPIGTVVESTRGIQANKQFIVLEPLVDFKHLEYVIVLRYKPEPEAIEGRENGRTDIEFVPLEPARPSPVIPEIASLYGSRNDESDNSDETEDPETVSPSPEPTDSPTPSPTTSPSPTPASEETPLQYVVVNPRGEPTPTPTPTPAPTSTPYFTPDPEDMTFEED